MYATASIRFSCISSTSTLINTIPHHYNVQQYTDLDHVCKQASHLLVTELVHQISTVVGNGIFISIWYAFGINLSHLH